MGDYWEDSLAPNQIAYIQAHGGMRNVSWRDLPPHLCPDCGSSEIFISYGFGWKCSKCGCEW